MVKVREDTRVRRMVYTQERGSLERKTYLLGRKNNMHDWKCLTYQTLRLRKTLLLIKDSKDYSFDVF